MPGDKQLDHLIGMLYETVLEPSLWRDTVGLCGQYAGDVDAQLLTMSKKTETPISAILVETYFPDQLRNVFNKTNTNRQSELVALLSRVPQLHD